MHEFDRSTLSLPKKGWLGSLAIVHVSIFGGDYHEVEDLDDAVTGYVVF